MRILVAPDSFKESLSAVAVARAIAAGVRDALPDSVIDLCPLADGGEGTVEAMVAAAGGQFRTAQVVGPLGEARQGRFGVVGGTGFQPVPPSVGGTGFQPVPPSTETAGTGCRPVPPTAVIEMAEAAGLALVPPERRNPLKTTTFGVGQLIRAALNEGCRRLVIGIGGSATTDGGAGCAQALGVVFIRRDGRPFACGMTGGDLLDIARIDAGDRDDRLSRCAIRVACDVDNPLTGPNGAAAVYGPQKGATPEMVGQLDAGLANLAEVIRRDLVIDVERLGGAGAAGGLGAGLVAFAGALLQPGIQIVAEAVGLAGRIQQADLVITGEGKLDSQSAAGKTAVGVARLAAAAGKPVICIPGQAAPDAPRALFVAVCPLVAGNVTVEQALGDPGALLRRRAAEAMRQFLEA